MKILKTFEQFVQQTSEPETNPEKDLAFDDELKKKKEEDEKELDIQVDPALDLKLDSIRK